MKIRRSAILLLLLALPAVAEETTVPFHGSAIRFASVEQARKFIGSADDWTRSLSPFDRAVRLKSQEPVDERKFLSFASKQALPWEESAIEAFSAAVAEVAAKIDELGLRLSLPDEILVVRTTGDEEMGDPSYYTRGATIVISHDQIDLETARHFFLHELFHVMTRHDPSIRRPLYALIGFEPCGEIRYPDALQPRRLTNPDAYHYDSCIELTAGGRPIHAVLLTLAKSLPYEKGGIMENLSVEFLELERRGDDKRPAMNEGRPVLHAVDSVEGFFDKIGRNTRYIIHPEEIMAENFTMAILGKADAPNPEILRGVVEQLSKP